MTFHGCTENAVELCEFTMSMLVPTQDLRVDLMCCRCYLKNASYFQMAASATVGSNANTTVSGQVCLPPDIANCCISLAKQVPLATKMSFCS